MEGVSLSSLPGHLCTHSPARLPARLPVRLQESEEEGMAVVQRAAVKADPK